ncbi:MAG: hypothetical protein II075_07695, partial [Bacteroidales bacterium]|nr:hypothetical protein [Bacteroidales bacterium]
MKKIIAYLVALVATIAACNPYGSEIPSKLNGNWINLQTGNWDYGFYEEFAIANNDFWKYSSVSKEEIVLTKESGNGADISLKINIVNDTTLTINGVEYQKYDFSDFSDCDDYEIADRERAKCAAYMLSKSSYYPDVKEDTTDFRPHKYYRGDSAVIIFYERNTAQGINSFGRRFDSRKTRYMDVERLNEGCENYFIGNGAEPVDTIEHYGMRYVFKVPVEGVSIVHDGNLLENWGTQIYLPCIAEPGDTIAVFLSRETFENFPYRNEYYIAGNNVRFHREQQLFYNYLVSKGVKTFNDALSDAKNDMDYYKLRHDEYVRDTTLLNEFIAQCRMPLSKKFVRFNRLTLLYKFASEVVYSPEAEDFIKQNINIKEDDMFIGKWGFKFTMDYALRKERFEAYSEANLKAYPNYIVSYYNRMPCLVNPKVLQDMGFSDDFIEMFRYQHFECYWRKADYSYVFTDNEKQQILSNFKNEDYISEVTGILDYKENLWADCFNQYQGNVVMACLWNPIDEHSIKAINEMKKLHVEFAPKGVEFVYVSDNIQMAYNSNIRELLEYTRCTHYEWGDRQYKDFMKKF